MDRKEFAIFVHIMRTGYQKDTLLNDKASLETWYALLKDIPYDTAKLALQKHIMQNKWPPSIAEIRESALAVSGGDSSEWSEEWGKVMKAIKRYGYVGEKDALESLNPLTREVVKRLDWQTICRSDLDGLTAIRANFRMAYESETQKAKSNELLSEDFKNKAQILMNGDERLIE